MTPRAITVTRIVAAVVGATLTLTGLYFLLTTEPPRALLGLVIWLAATVIAHDGLFVPAVTVANRTLARATARLSASVVVTIRILFAAGLVLTLLVVPELVAQARPHANPTVLVGDYGVRLLVVWGVIVAVTAAVIAVAVWRTRRNGVRPRSTRA